MKNILLTIGICLPFFSLSQNLITKNIPATPNATSLSMYGQVPVSLHTGIPNIVVPITNLYSKDLSVPVNLSYHAGGIKVEEVSSWVGLGWSLMAGGVITRQVRSVPDEDAHSFSSSKPYSNTEVMNLYESGYLNASIPIQLALNGQLDLEPDIFYFNFGSESGQFFYDETSLKFVSVNNSMNIIQYNNLTGGWIITTNDGTTYFFDDFETSQTSALPCKGNSGFTKTAWYLSKIENYNKTDVIQFNYQSYNYRFETLYESDRHFVTDPNADCSTIDFGPEVTNCFQSNEFNSKRLISIIARSGKVEFVVNPDERLDLPDDHALEKIKVFNSSGLLTETFQLNQDYFGNVIEGSPSVNYRLKLNYIDKLTENFNERFRTFEYSSYELPSRISYAQDYWGYYNGQLGNRGLIPRMVLQTAGGPLIYQGANRYPSSEITNFEAGMLKKVIYPTGGHSSFEYENHQVNESFVPLVVLKRFDVAIYDYETRNGDSFTINFRIEELPSVVNGDNPEGGAFVDVNIDGITCEYGQTTGYAQSGCAIISISGPTGFTITNNITDRFLPNGDYTLTLNFSSNSDPTSWEDFYASVSWQSKETTTDQSAPIGGLRIKRISDYDPISSSTQQEKLYFYNDENNPSLSSAKFWQRPSFERDVFVLNEVSCENCTLTYNCSCVLLSANSTYPVSGLMSNVTYSNVTVLQDESGTLGKSTHTFMNPTVLSNTTFPYLPSYSASWMAGNLIHQTDYVYSNNNFKKIKELQHVYSTFLPEESLAVRIVPSYLGKEIQYRVMADNYFMNGHFIVSPYTLKYNNYLHKQSTIIRHFDPDNALSIHEIREDYTISPLHLNVVSKQVSTSNGSTIVNSIKYPSDYMDSGTDGMSLSIGALKSRNMLNIPIESTVWRKYNSIDSILLEGSLTLFDIKNGMLLPSKSLRLKSKPSFNESEIVMNNFIIDENYEVEYEFLDYDGLGNLLNAKKRNDYNEFLIYDKFNQKVVCKGIGGDFADVFYESFEDLDTGFSTDSYTGLKSYNQVYTVPGIGSRLLTYWKKETNSNWQLISTNITGTHQIGGSGVIIDEVRVHKQGTLLTTYSYNKFDKVASINDPNNYLMRYDYDEFGRLKIIYDDNGNAIKKFEYKYLEN
jgi:YD repeat-containing protein